MRAAYKTDNLSLAGPFLKHMSSRRHMLHGSYNDLDYICALRRASLAVYTRHNE